MYSHEQAIATAYFPGDHNKSTFIAGAKISMYKGCLLLFQQSLIRFWPQTDDSSIEEWIEKLEIIMDKGLGSQNLHHQSYFCQQDRL